MKKKALDDGIRRILGEALSCRRSCRRRLQVTARQAGQEPASGLVSTASPPQPIHLVFIGRQTLNSGHVPMDLRPVSIGLTALSGS